MAPSRCHGWAPRPQGGAISSTACAGHHAHKAGLLAPPLVFHVGLPKLIVVVPAWQQRERAAMCTHRDGSEHCAAAEIASEQHPAHMQRQAPHPHALKVAPTSPSTHQAMASREKR